MLLHFYDFITLAQAWGLGGPSGKPTVASTALLPSAAKAQESILFVLSFNLVPLVKVQHFVFYTTKH